MNGRKNVLDFHDHRFSRVTKDVLNDEKYLDKPAQKLVYAILCMYADNTSMKSHPSIQTLARKACCSENTVRAALIKLEAENLLSIRRRKNGKKNFSNEYTLLVPPEKFNMSTSNSEGGYFTT
ncbi:helix-turn-helix domain-containing protein [Sporosarcina koreensis]|uniref:helix-turn-helix domain-containing protein n=1 Tax=Sporosarcina koreensis TaxID=334735 RepID=UPI00075CD8FE